MIRLGQRVKLDNTGIVKRLLCVGTVCLLASFWQNSVRGENQFSAYRIEAEDVDAVLIGIYESLLRNKSLVTRKISTSGSSQVDIENDLLRSRVLFARYPTSGELKERFDCLLQKLNKDLPARDVAKTQTVAWCDQPVSFDKNGSLSIFRLGEIVIPTVNMRFESNIVTTPTLPKPQSIDSLFEGRSYFREYSDRERAIVPWYKNERMTARIRSLNPDLKLPVGDAMRTASVQGLVVPGLVSIVDLPTNIPFQKVFNLGTLTALSGRDAERGFFWNTWWSVIDKDYAQSIDARYLAVAENKRYQVTVDLAPVNYRDRLQAKTRAFDPTLYELAAQLDPVRLGTKFRLLVIPDKNVFDKEPFEATYSFDAEKVFRYASNSDWFDIPPNSQYQDMVGKDLFFARLTFELAFKKGTCAGRVAFILYDEDYPVDDFSVLWANQECQPIRANNTATFVQTRASLSTILAPKWEQPVGSIVIHEGAGDDTTKSGVIVGVFRAADTLQDCNGRRYCAWDGPSPESFRESLDSLTKDIQTGYGFSGLAMRGVAMVDILTSDPARPQNDGVAAGRALVSFIRGRVDSSTKLIRSGLVPPLFVVRAIPSPSNPDAPPFMFPYGLLSAPGDPSIALGEILRVSMPFTDGHIQSPQAQSDCPDDWIPVFPLAPKDNKDSVIDAALQLMGPLAERAASKSALLGVRGASTIERVVNYFDDSNIQGSRVSTSLWTLTHHGKNKMAFNAQFSPSLYWSSLKRRVSSTSVAILNACATADQRNASSLIRLKALQFGAIVATATEILPELAGTFYKCLTESLEKSIQSRAIDGENATSLPIGAYGSNQVSHVLFRTQRCVATSPLPGALFKRLVELGERGEDIPEWQLNALKYFLLGNESLPICMPRAN